MQTENKLMIIVIGIMVAFVFKSLYDDSVFPKFIEGEIISISYTSGPWEHTTIYFRIYSETTLIRIFEGQVDLEYGIICRVHYIRKFLHSYKTILDIEILPSLGRTET